MRSTRYYKALIFLSLTLFLFSCGDDGDTGGQLDTTFGIFQIIDSNTVEMDGEIDSNTLADFNDMIASYPNINQINMREVPGSIDDEINLQVAKKTHDMNIAIHLMDNGLIASGGVDFFLAGTTRTKGDNTMIGVHSWSDGINEATDFPVGDPEHQPYITYYQSIGFTQSEAEDFYYFTINAAPASSIYYMTGAEIEQYKVLKP